MSAIAEHQFKQGSSGFVIKDTFSGLNPINLVGASAQFVFRSPEGDTNTVRSASFTTDSADETAATDITFSRVIGSDANLDAGSFVYEWKLIMADGGDLIFPINGATDDYQEREAYSFEIVNAISAPGDVVEADAQDSLIAITAEEGYQLTSIEYDSDGVITTATVLWPDGSAGVFMTTVKNTAFFAVDAYTITHTDSGKTVTQAAVTRDALGNVTTKPALTVS